jgi:hypothetical protein
VCRIGYTWTGGPYPLLTGIVRNEWDFRHGEEIQKTEVKKK